MNENQENRPATTNPAEQPASLAALRALVLEQQQQLEQQSLFIDQLLEQIRLARHQHFGVRSERFSLDQMALCFNEAEAAAAVNEAPGSAAGDSLGTVAVPAHRRSTGGRRPLPKAFPRFDVIHELDTSECHCGQCQGALTPVSEKISEQLDIIPATVRVLRHVRKTYACVGCDEDRALAGPADPEEPGLAGNPGTYRHCRVRGRSAALPAG
jgi:transposase